MKTAIRTLTVLLALMCAAVTTAQANGGHGGFRGGGHVRGYWGPGPFWGGVGIGIGVGIASRYYGPPWYPGYVVVDGPPVAYYPYYPEQRAAPPETVAKPSPDPVIYPRNGQTAAQTETDRRDCNRWATTQPSAMTDSSVFNRATTACMEGRGYTMR